MIKYIKSCDSFIIIIKIFNIGLFIKKSKKNNKNKIKEYKTVELLIKINKIEIYRYNNNLYKKTLHDCFYNSIDKLNYNRILNQYKKNLKNAVEINEIECKNIDYFRNRSYVLEKYLKSDCLKYCLICNNKKYNIKKIVESIKKNINKNKNLLSFITQGDPTDTNISIDGTFADLDNYGYNSVIGEMSILIASVFTHGNYFYPKYHKDAYAIRPSILKKYEKYKQYVPYKIERKNIFVYPEFRIPKKNKEYLIEYLLLFEKYKTNKSFRFLKYYICMRLLTPIRINEIEFDDLVIVLSLLVHIYVNVDGYDSLLKLIKNLNVMEE